MRKIIQGNEENHLLSEKQLFFSSDGKFIRPIYLDAGDHGWMRSLLEIYGRYVGRPRRELTMHLAQTDLGYHKKRMVVQKLLDKQFGIEATTKVPSPKKMRRAAFLEDGLPCLDERARQIRLAKSAKLLGISAKDLEANLYGDLPDEKLICQPKTVLSDQNMVLLGNLLMVQGFLRRSEKIRILLKGNVRPVIRHARWKGLICSIVHLHGSENIVIEISGPLSLVMRTQYYAKILGELVPYLAAADRFVLEAKLKLHKDTLLLRVKDGDPIFPRETSKKYDSKLEEKFAERFVKATDDWDLVREPRPFRVGNSFVFPDFALEHRTNRELTWYLEIVGFWTPEYLRDKMEKYSKVKIERLILCLRDSQRCSETELPKSAKIVRFKTVIHPKSVLDIIDEIGKIGDTRPITKSLSPH